MTTLTMEVQDVVLVVVCPRALAVGSIIKVYGFERIFIHGDIMSCNTHFGQLNRSNSTFVNLTELLKLNPI